MVSSFYRQWLPRNIWVAFFVTKEINLCSFIFIINLLFNGFSSYLFSKLPSQHFCRGFFFLFFFLPDRIIAGEMLQCENSV